MQSYSRMNELTPIWRAFRKRKISIIGLVILTFYVIVAVVSPYISPYDPLQVGSGPSLSPPTREHLLGTDDLGRDILSGVTQGARISLVIGSLATLTSTTIGTLVGAIAGFYGRYVDNALMRITEVFMLIPPLIFALVLVTITGSSVWNIILVVGVLSWPKIARVVRGEFLSLKEREYVVAARAAGSNDRTLMFGEILPNAMGVVIPLCVMDVSRAILLEAGLSFLGLGDPNVPSWGYMLNNAMSTLRTGWWTALFPGLAISLIAIALNVVGDGLDDALNPRTY